MTGGFVWLREIKLTVKCQVTLMASLQFSSVAQSCPALCDPMDCSMPGSSVRHQLLEFTQTHVCGVGDAIQPSHPLLSPSPSAFNLSQIRVFSNESVLHIRLATIGVSASATVLPMNIKDWFPSGWTGWISQVFLGLEKSSKGLWSLLHHHSSKTLIRWHSVFVIVQLSHIHTWLLEKL